MPLASVAAGQPIRSTHITQFTRWVTGATKDQSANFITTHATEYTVTATNEETGAGLMLKGVYGGTTAFTFNKTGATFNIPIISTSTLLASLFSSAGQLLVGSGGTGVSALNIGSAFQNLGVNSAATGLTYVASLQSLLASAGSLIGASGANTPAHIPKGTTAFMSLVMAAGATGQTWASCAVTNAVTAGDLFYASGPNVVTRLAIGATGTFLTVAGGVPSWATGGAVSLSTVVASLSTNVAMSTSASFFDGPSISLTAGTWDIQGVVNVYDSTVATNIVGKLWDGTTVEASCTLTTSGANVSGPIPLEGIVALATSATWKISCRDLNGTNGVISATSPAASQGNNASYLKAKKIA